MAMPSFEKAQPGRLNGLGLPAATVNHSTARVFIPLHLPQLKKSLHVFVIPADGALP